MFRKSHRAGRWTEGPGLGIVGSSPGGREQKTKQKSFETKQKKSFECVLRGGGICSEQSANWRLKTFPSVKRLRTLQGLRDLFAMEWPLVEETAQLFLEARGRQEIQGRFEAQWPRSLTPP